ncbi:unnamed protein product [Caenorhabditis brenneri]
MDDMEMPFHIIARNADDNGRVVGKVLLCCLIKLIETDNIGSYLGRIPTYFGTFLKSNERWLCLYQASTSVLKDLVCGTTRNTFQAVFFSGAYLLGGKLGNFAGNSLGNLCPSVTGKWCGILFGMLFGYACGTKTVDVVSNIADRYNYDIELRNCKDCQSPFTYRRYKREYADYCGNCRQVPPVIQFRIQWARWNR